MTTDSLSSMRSAAGLLGEPTDEASSVSSEISRMALQSLYFDLRQRMLDEIRPHNPLTTAAIYEECATFAPPNKPTLDLGSSPEMSPVLDSLNQYIRITNCSVSLWPSLQSSLGLDKIYVVPTKSSLTSFASRLRFAKTKPVLPIRVGDIMCARWDDVGWVRPIPSHPVKAPTDRPARPLLEVEIKVSRLLLPDESLGKATIDLSSVSPKRLTQCRVEFEGGFFMATLRVCFSFIPFDRTARKEALASFSFGAPRSWYHRLFPCLPFRVAGHDLSVEKSANKKDAKATIELMPRLAIDLPEYCGWKRGGFC